ncbi:MAG TPA: hypothetical protein VFV51_18890 [Vicinamibacterales bacterium]|nr:hypothetical protein [Vicinamibacterales bacterium]
MMSEFTIRSESVDVEQIMKQIRARILEKRGADYTEDQIRELASVRLEKFLDSKNLRSDLLEQFRKSRPAVNVDPPKIEAPYAFDDQTLFASHRAPLRLMRKLLMPVLKLFFNPNVLNQILHTQAQFNVDLLKREARRKIEFDRSRAEWNSLYYEVLHNLVLETTRMGIEVQNLRMRVESLSSRLDFSERRVRALEGVVQYRPEVVRAPERQRDHADAEPAAAHAGQGAALEGFVPGSGAAQPGQGDGSGRRRRRRRRGRRGQGALGTTGAPGAAGPAGALGAEPNTPEDSQGFDDGGEDEGEDMELSGFDIPEPPEPVDVGGAGDAPREPEASQAPEPPKAPEANEDDLQ